MKYSEIALTLNIYSHVLTKLQNEAAAKIDELLTPIEYREDFLRETRFNYYYLG